jgi:uncharacterized protein YkwD
MQSKRLWVLSALCLMGSACAGDDGAGSDTRTGSPGSVTPPPMTMLPIGTAGSPAAPPTMTMTMMPPVTGTPTMMPVAGSGAPTMMPVAGSGAPTMMPVAGSGAPAMPPGDPSMCEAAPAGASAPQVAALAAINTARLAAGAGCVHMVAELNTAAQKHCEYYHMNENTNCTADPHSEVMGCAGYVGDLGARLQAAGYMSRGGYGEVMAFLNNPQGAVDTWINSVWHRIPMLDPWSKDMGYGATDACDTMDFGASTTAVPNDTVLVYPYDGQTGVVPSFNGMYEGPTPPAPPSGWPSAMPVTLYGKMLNITEHVLTKDGDTAPLSHTWITGSDPMWGKYLRNAVFMYGDAPFENNTKYHVKMSGTYQGGALTREWSFTTGTAPTWGRR